MAHAGKVALVCCWLAGCHGFAQTATIGPAFGDRTSVIASVELAGVARAEPGERRTLGGAAAGGASMIVDGDGATAGASGGLDYLPVVFENGTVVGLGAHVGYGVGYGVGTADGVRVLPRLWFTVGGWTLAGAPLAIGAMLRCHIGVVDDAPYGCGPMLVVTRGP